MSKLGVGEASFVEIIDLIHEIYKINSSKLQN